MGKLILCSGSSTKRPYRFVSTGVRVYSIEELCYYLYHHVYQIEEEMFCDTLVDWIKTELMLADRAEKLKQLKRQKADIKTMVTVILCSADYYTEHEIKSLLKTLDEIIGMPLIKRSCIRAKHCLANQEYQEATAEYERILNSGEASDLSPEDYGDILHNLAVAKVHISGLKEASELFAQAYERNHREESLCQYLCSLQLSSKNSLYDEKREEYQVSEELHNNITNYLKQASEDAVESEMMREVQSLRQSREQGKLIDYYKKTDEMIEEWKAKIR